jgi:hypothetical protein
MTHYGWTANQAYGEMQQYDFNHGFGHGALKDFVYSYYSQLAQNRVTTDGKPAKSESQGQRQNPGQGQNQGQGRSQGR